MANHQNGLSVDHHHHQDTLFQHRKKTRQLAVSHLRNSIVCTVSLILLLVMMFTLPKMMMRIRGGAPGWIDVVIGVMPLVVLIGLTRRAYLAGACNLFCAAEEDGRDPSDALDHVESWKIWCHLGRAISVIILIALPFILYEEMPLVARFIFGGVNLVLIGVILATEHMGNKHVNRYIEELEGDFNKGDEKSRYLRYSSSAPHPPAPPPSSPRRIFLEGDMANVEFCRL